ncbi:protein FAR1-RELATED SEQUENCE 1-like isoform X2 [Henckelia pumila]|uniref:protein FAR1-RELATED SEQUENCE 1-like isoform X2 n=1 Tax=Henckelia pumila TaxID=405737 RepID=UPI003C6DCCFE
MGDNIEEVEVANSEFPIPENVENYEKIQKSWREREKVEDTRCHHMKAPTMVKNNPLLNFAANVYTLTVYKLFELEFINSLNMRLAEMPSNLSEVSLGFKVKSHDESSRIRHVFFNKQMFDVKCSCQKFESMRILCKHILMIFNFMNVNFLPKQCLKNRWMKNSKKRIDALFMDESRSGSGSGSGHESETVFVNQIMRSTYALSMRCKVHENSRNKLKEIIDDAMEQINSFFENLKLEDPKLCHDEFHEENILLDDILVLNPPQLKSRGITNKNIQLHWDDKSKKRKGKRKGDRANAKGTKIKGQSSQPLKVRSANNFKILFSLHHKSILIIHLILHHLDLNFMSTNQVTGKFIRT